MTGGDFENPEGNPPGPRAGAVAGFRRVALNSGRSGSRRARRVARGIFKIPEGQRGTLGTIPDKKTRILYIFFYEIHLNFTNNHAVEINSSYAQNFLSRFVNLCPPPTSPRLGGYTPRSPRLGGSGRIFPQTRGYTYKNPLGDSRTEIP